MLQKIKNIFRRSDPTTALYFGRVTTDQDYFTGGVFGTVVSPEEDNDWKLQSITDAELKKKSASEILDILADSSPDVNRALYDMHQNLVTEYVWTTKEDDATGNQILEDAIGVMEEKGESVLVKLGQLVDSGFLKGSLFAENVFDNEEFIDIVVIDPFRARFQRQRNDERGEFWQLGQRQDGQFIPITSPYVRYIPLIPRTDKAYGRPMAAAALYPVIFLLGLLKSARQSMHLQAFPNRLITVDREHLSKSGYDVDQINKILKDLQGELPAQMAATTTGTQYIQGREVDIQMVGGVTRVSYDGLEMMEKMLERMIIRGLKQYPINFGISEGSGLSSGNADQQIEQFSIAIDSFMRRIEGLFSIFGTQILNNYGNASTATFQLKRNHSAIEAVRASRMKDKVELISMALQAAIITEEEGRQIFKLPDALERLSELLEDDTEFQRMLEERQQAIEQQPEVDDDE